MMRDYSGIVHLQSDSSTFQIGFIHRDIKPANLAVGCLEGATDPSVIHMLDFGLAREFIYKVIRQD